MNFKLKPWADEFVTLRMELYYQEFGDLTEGAGGYGEALEKEDCNELLGCCNLLRHRGFGGVSRSAPKCGRISGPAALSPPYHERAQPESASARPLASQLARQSGTSYQCVHQIVHER